MKSFARFSSSVRAARRPPSPSFPPNRALDLCAPSGADFTAGRTVVARQPRVTAVRTFHHAPVAAAAVQVAPPVTTEAEPNVYRAHLSPYAPYIRQRSSGAALVHLQTMMEGDVIPELCSGLAHFPGDERADGLATLLGACAEWGLEARSPLVVRLINGCLELLSGGGVRVSPLCHLGEVARALEGRRSALVTQVLASLCGAVREDGASPSEAVRIYSLLAQCHDPASRRHKVLLSALHRSTRRQVHGLNASQVSDVLQSLSQLQQRQAVSLVLRLSRRASQVLKAFSDAELTQVLSALMMLGHHSEELLYAVEEHLPGRLGKCDPELISTVVEYCLRARRRSEPIFEAVAENFVDNAETHTSLQIAKQIVSMGRLNYLPQCSSEMFRTLESILSARFAQFPPRSLLEVLHACIHLERFPLNHMAKVFSPHFLQRLRAQGEPLDNNALGQLTQLHLSSSLECSYYWGPRLPFFLHVKNFSSVDQAFETPMESRLYNQVKGPLAEMLGGRFYNTRVFTRSGYTIDVEICLDEDGYVLPPAQWDHTYKRMALCLDGEKRFCSKTQHLLGKEATKRRHLRRVGYELVQIPFFEFEELRTLEEQVQYLHDKIFPTILKFNH
ncbi:FAST kinase domain-containing protein 3, mitochondrial-like [Pungitius pungitius]|uniref:FAST kinase domain-containing protein 3, mitochondrial-like n=1 Tax=Pungitius pungitius TaxID=134920 RepID=UPI002E15EE33